MAPSRLTERITAMQATDRRRRLGRRRGRRPRRPDRRAGAAPRRLRRPGLRAGAALSEIGAGVQVSPNASRVLHGLGLAEELARAGVRPLAWHQRRWDDGRTLLRTPLAEPLEAAFGFPHYQIHRADLLAALAARPARRAGARGAPPDRRSRTAETGSSCGSRAAPAPRRTCWWPPTASTRRCGARCSARSSRASRAASPIAAWSPPSGCATSGSRSPRRSGWGPGGTSCTTS